MYYRGEAARSEFIEDLQIETVAISKKVIRHNQLYCLPFCQSEM